jgi:hypothetical protein
MDFYLSAMGSSLQLMLLPKEIDVVAQGNR